jgi:hypothetical protein
MMKVWEFSGVETLQTPEIKDANPTWNGIIPVPRMVTNQLNHFFELNMARLDAKILKGVEELLRKKEKRMWVVATLVHYILLYTREVDAARNFYWNRYKDKVWRP